jgi:hypothetical protein
VARLLLAESLILSLAASVPAILAAWWVGALLEGTPVLQGLPPASRAELDWRVLAFALGASTVVALVAGLLPALTAGRVPVTVVLAETGRSTTPGRRRLRRALTATQVVVSVLLLVGAALLSRSMMAKGYMLMRAAAKEYGWNLNYGGIALMWRGGCIIRSAFLGKIKEAFDKNPKLSNLLLDDFFRKAIKESQKSWRNIVAISAKKGIPTPAFSTALAFYDQYRSERLPANLLQAQRDFFGAHTYERVDKPRGEFFHTNWTGRGGETSAGSYNA